MRDAAAANVAMRADRAGVGIGDDGGRRPAQADAIQFAAEPGVQWPGMPERMGISTPSIAERLEAPDFRQMALLDETR